MRIPLALAVDVKLNFFPMFRRVKIGAIAIPALLVSLLSCASEKEHSSASDSPKSDSLFEYRWTGEVVFDDSGNVVEGTRTAYFISGEKFSEVPVKNGREDGTMRVWDQEGIKTAEIEFSGGVQNGKSVFWYENGNKRLEIDFVDGFENGTWKNWYPDGALWIEGEVKNGNRVGIWTEWHPNGVKKSEGPYEVFEIDRPNATSARLSDHGAGPAYSEDDSLLDSISPDSIYSRHAGHAHPVGLRHGIWTEWDETGAVSRTILYQKGVPSK